MTKRLTNESVKEYVENNPDKVTRTQSKRYPELYVLKYKRKVFYNNLWDEFLENFRGTVVDKDYNPVIMPFTKIYNRGENGADIDRFEPVVAVRKVNGFMAAATYVPSLGKVLVSTTGSLDSEYVDMAEDYIGKEQKEVIEEVYKFMANDDPTTLPCTWLFELCHPNDPHVVPEQYGAYLLDCRYVDWGSHSSSDEQNKLDVMAEQLGVRRPEHIRAPFGVITRKAKYALHEGYVVHGKDTSLKIKSPYYLTIKFLGRKNQEKLQKNPVDPKGLQWYSYR